MTAPSPRPSPRFTYIDALRGLAAVWVAAHHFYPGVSNHYQDHPFPEPLPTIIHNGGAGVNVFFVLSGFVIAFSLRNARYTLGYCGNFMLRRSIRLEPPYWATIALAIAAAYVSNLIRTDRVAPLPSWSQLLAHVFYLQDVLGMGNILTIFWTLCLEVQFYLTFLLLSAVAQALGDWWGKGETGQMWMRLLVFAPLTAWSLGQRLGLLHSPPGFMVQFWYQFFLGVVAWWALSGQVHRCHFWAFVMIVAGAMAWRRSFYGDVGLWTAISIFVAGRLDRLDRWLDYWPLQHLGRISYSLYLIHPVVGDPVVYYLRGRLVGAEFSPLVACGFFVAAFTVSIVGAQLMYWFIEKPSVALAKELRMKEHGDTSAAPHSEPPPSG
jgi:peptidoglycan/LPS O-acetylase OafA/YrhL